ncbi:MAG: hypothetical protein H7067_15355 [Burkholderiales bacterium]|nr:hypothetical protein [Opitutaceae bacterium]
MKHLLALFLLLAVTVHAAVPFTLTLPSGAEVKVTHLDARQVVFNTTTEHACSLPTPTGLDLANPDKTALGQHIAAEFKKPAPAAVVVHRILKDTLIQRVKAANKLAGLRAMIASLDDDARFEWDNSSWFSSDNALIVGGVAALQLEAAVILAADPLAP